MKKKYPSQSLIFSWDSEKCPSEDFTNTLSASVIEADRLVTNHPYRVIKAGFTAIAPSAVSNAFLFLFETYSIGDNPSAFFVRLFSFYYCDQLALLLAIKDIYLNEEYKQKVSWIDMHSSNIVNTNSARAEYMWCPKGNTVQAG
jgi:hypothetical protein